MSYFDEKSKSGFMERLTICILTLLAVVFVFPILLVIMVSISNEKDVLEYGYKLIPKGIDFAAYKYIFKNPVAVLDAYKVTIAFSIISTLAATLFQAMMAYPLANKGFSGKRFLSFYLYFTCLFSGGLIPTYILNTQYLHLNNTIWIYIIPALISPWHVFMIRTFFQDIPYEMVESAIVDGANEYLIFFKFMIPLSKPVLATVALLTFLAKWNDWYTALLYIDNQKLVSLQYLLQRILNNIRILKDSGMNALDVAAIDIPNETARLAMAVVAAGPALMVFPFFQKYFVRGLTVGSVKG